MNRTQKLTLSNKQIDWLCELITCENLKLIPFIIKSDKDIIAQTLYAKFYYEYERVILNQYLKQYPLPLLQKLLRERK